MKTRFFIVMGVSGCGKTTVGKHLASRLGWDFYDADDFHPPTSIAKMARGVPLDDNDRVPWLESLHELISDHLKVGRTGVLACSALKGRYRKILLADNDDAQVVYLKGSFDLIQSRLSARAGHYMKASMLQSQFDTLEEPTEAVTVDASLPADDIVAIILELSK